MSASAEGNFAARLLRRLGGHSQLIDAATGEVVLATDVPDLIVAAAAAFHAAGLEPGDRVVVACSLNPGSALAYLGAMYGGFVPVLLEERALPASGAALCAATRAKILWTDRDVVCAWAHAAGVRHLTGRFTGRAARPLPPAPRAGHDLAALMPTSGSTNGPRLVRVTHGNLVANTEAIIRSQSLGRDERAMLILPVSYCFGASVLHTHLYQGGGVVFDTRFMFPDKVLHAINAWQCTTFAGVPTAYHLLLGRSSLRSIRLPSLRRFLQAGGALEPGSIERMRAAVPTAKFYVMYGQTEATARISCLPPERLTDKLGSAGPPLDNVAARVVDSTGRDVPPGHTGEIWVKGPSICDGYFEAPDDTARKFSDGWLKTGDLGAMDQEGFLWIKGRKSDFLKIRGLRVSFGEIEARVATIAGVLECAATAVRHLEAGEAIELFVVPADAAEAAELPTRIRRALPPYWTCAAIHVVNELPRTSNGKVARSLLSEQPSG